MHQERKEYKKVEKIFLQKILSRHVYRRSKILLTFLSHTLLYMLINVSHILQIRNKHFLFLLNVTEISEEEVIASERQASPGSSAKIE